MKYFILILAVFIATLTFYEPEKPKRLSQDIDRVPFTVFVQYKGFEDGYDEEVCSLEECKDRASNLRDIDEVSFTICLENMPVANFKGLRKKCSKGN